MYLRPKNGSDNEIIREGGVQVMTVMWKLVVLMLQAEDKVYRENLNNACRIQEAVVHGFGMVLSNTRELVNVSAMLSGVG
jgi:hypothetical protein